MSNDKIDRSETYRISLNLADDNDVRIIGYSFVKPKTIVLDVGCACGDLGSLLKKNKDCTTYGFEYNEGSIRIARDIETYERIHQIDLNTFSVNNFSEYLCKFDYIVALDVLEHLYDPYVVINKLKQFLKPDGCFIISLPNIAHGSIIVNILQNDFTYTETGILDKTHIRFFTYKSVAKLLSACGLEINGMDARVSGYYGKIKLPWIIKRYIMRSVHSYAVQYVATASISNKTGDDLLKTNMCNFDLKSDTIKKRIHTIKMIQLQQYVFPNGSARYRFLKYLKRVLNIARSKESK